MEPQGERQQEDDEPVFTFFDELRRRNVYRVATLYSVVGWVVIQAGNIALDAFHAPPWMLQLLIIVTVVGFPVALVIGWAFELGDKGLKWTVNRDGSFPRQAKKVQLYIAGATGVGLTVLGLLVTFQWLDSRTVVDKSQANSTKRVPVLEKSIAVLPLRSLGGADDDFLAAGFQDDLITRLAGIRQLRVASADVVRRFASLDFDGPSIGRKLGVAHVLSGSLRRAPDRFRLNAQLVEVKSERVLWAKSFDRNPLDTLKVQSELATEIAESLRALLSPEERVRLDTPDSRSIDAYEMYLKARQLKHEEGLLLLEKVVQIDPAFARAWAQLGTYQANLYQWNIIHTPQQRAVAQASFERAIQLAPHDPEVRAAFAFFYAQCFNDWHRAEKEMLKVIEQRPNNANDSFGLARIQSHQGRANTAIANYRIGWHLEPASFEIPWFLFQTHTVLRRYTEARDVLSQLGVSPEFNHYSDKALRVGPSPLTVLDLAMMRFRESGDTAAARSAIALIPNALQGNPGVQKRLRNVAWELGDAKNFLRHAQAFEARSTAPLQHLYMGLAFAEAGQMANSQQWLERSESALRKTVSEQPENGRYWSILGLLLAVQGSHPDEALQAAQKAITLVPLSEDTYEANIVRALYACTLAWTGRKQASLRELERLLLGFYEGNWSYFMPVYVEHLRRGLSWKPMTDWPPFAEFLANPRFKAPVENLPNGAVLVGP